ncbi:MAG: 50S ribosomal protein L25 [bacterium]|nr:50S ribosomal protein L25 [bacterium]
MEKTTITVKKRGDRGKGYLSAKRREGFIPAVLYGGKKEPEHLLLSLRELEVALHRAKGAHIFELTGDSEPESVVIKEKQVSPVKNKLIHIDFMRVSKDVKIEVEVEVELIGTPEGTKDGGVLEQQTHQIRIKTLPADIPEAIKVNVEALKIGDRLYVRDIPIDSQIEILEPEDKLIASLLPPRVAQEGAPTESTEAEPEVVSRGKKEKEST